MDRDQWSQVMKGVSVWICRFSVKSAKSLTAHIWAQGMILTQIGEKNWCLLEYKSHICGSFFLQDDLCP